MIKPKLLISSVAFLAFATLFTNCSESNSKTGNKSAINANGELASSDSEIEEDAALEPIDTALYTKKIKDIFFGLLS